MATVTISKTEYELLKKKASLYEQVLKPQLEKKYKIERYSLKRLEEFLSQDRLDLDQKILLRLKKVLRASQSSSS